jgi:hypothetical protein
MSSHEGHEAAQEGRLVSLGLSVRIFPWAARCDIPDVFDGAPPRVPGATGHVAEQRPSVAKGALGSRGRLQLVRGEPDASLTTAAPAFGYAAVVYIAAPKPLRADSARWTCPACSLNHDTGHLDRRRAVVAGAVLSARFGPRVAPSPGQALAAQWSESHFRGRGWCESDPSLTGRGSPGRRQLLVPSGDAPGGLCR